MKRSKLHNYQIILFLFFSLNNYSKHLTAKVTKNSNSNKNSWSSNNNSINAAPKLQFSIKSLYTPNYWYPSSLNTSFAIESHVRSSKLEFWSSFLGEYGDCADQVVGMHSGLIKANLALNYTLSKNGSLGLSSSSQRDYLGFKSPYATSNFDLNPSRNHFQTLPWLAYAIANNKVTIGLNLESNSSYTNPSSSFRNYSIKGQDPFSSFFIAYDLVLLPKFLSLCIVWDKASIESNSPWNNSKKNSISNQIIIKFSPKLKLRALTQWSNQIYREPTISTKAHDNFKAFASYRKKRDRHIHLDISYDFWKSFQLVNQYTLSDFKDRISSQRSHQYTFLVSYKVKQLPPDTRLSWVSILQRNFIQRMDWNDAI